MVRYRKQAVPESSPEAWRRDTRDSRAPSRCGAALTKLCRRRMDARRRPTPRRDRSRESEGRGRVVLRARTSWVRRSRSRSRDSRPAWSPSPYATRRHAPSRPSPARADSHSPVAKRPSGRGQSAASPPPKAPGLRDRVRPARPAARGPSSRSPSRRGASRNASRDASRSEQRERRPGREQHYMQMAQQAAFMQYMHHPGYMAMVQQQMGMMPQMMHMGMPGMGMRPWGKARERGGSSSGDSYSSSESQEEGAKRSVASARVPPEVEEFLQAATELEVEVANRLRDMPPHLQQEVMRRGPLDVRSPTSSLLSRMKQAMEADRSGYLLRGGPGMNGGMRPVKQSAKAAIEALINDFKLGPECSWMLRSLPPDKQKLAARIDPSGQADASGYVAEELKRIV
mmetsp:Transcript_52240/g.97779  ORF Transcript_52240/g.97779 Transcript_52240/m.97779 type:complete len:399 (-) Transcript_52240:44-1240(-)